MKRGIIATLALLIATTGAMARQLSESEARTIAVQKFSAIGKAVPARQLKSITPTSATAPIYVFNNAADQGFVVVAGDDRMPSLVLGYGDKGAIDTDDCAPALKGWLEAQSQMAEAIQSGKLKAPARIEGIDFSKPVEPLVASKWNQLDPYNRLTPTIDGKHCPTGCAATALAQVLYHWKYPQNGLKEHSYVWRDSTITIDFTKSNYQWDLMTPTYDALDPAEFTGLEIGAENNATKISFTVTASGVADIATDAAEAEYFNLQGVKIENPAEVPGIYIVRRGTAISKITVN